MFVDSQLAQLNNPGMQPCSTTTVEHACALCQDQTGALHMFCDTEKSESCLVKAPAKHASESAEKSPSSVLCLLRFCAQRKVSSGLSSMSKRKQQTRNNLRARSPSQQKVSSGRALHVRQL